MNIYLATALGKFGDQQLVMKDATITKKKDDRDLKTVELAQIIHQFAMRYGQAMHIHDPYAEAFSFSTGQKEGWMVIKEDDPTTVQHKHASLGSLPWHIAFGQNIIKKGTGLHTWKVKTDQTFEDLKVGIYFGNSAENIQYDFGHGKPTGFIESYFLASPSHVAGIYYKDGATFGGQVSRIGKIGKGVLTMGLDANTASLSFQKEDKTTSFAVKELTYLQQEAWEAILFVAIGSGGPYGKHQVTIDNYVHQLAPIPKL